MGIIRGLLIVIILIALGTAGFFYYQQQAATNQLYQEVNAPSQATQFAKNLRFDTNNISYFISKDCSVERKNKLEQALEILSNQTKILNFYSAEQASAEILVGCSKNSYEEQKNVFAAGEGGPTAYINLSYYPLIKRGKVILYEKSDCSYPVVELHELLHVLGFAHINNKTSVMYPYGGCNHKLDQSIIEILKRIYLVQPLPELLFSGANATKEGKFIILEMEVTNQGLKDASNISVDIYADNKKLDPVDLGNIEIGVTENIKIPNLSLPSDKTSEIKLEIVYGLELDKSNNVRIIKI